MQQPRHPDDMICDEDGSRPLMLASDRGHAEVVHLLLEAGADRNLANDDGDTALMLASKTGRIEVVRLLLDAGADRNKAYHCADDGIRPRPL